jgi:hypothetical protein
LDKGDGVWDAGIDEMDRGIETGDFDAGVEFEILRDRHGDADIFTDHFGGEGSGDRFKGHTLREFWQKMSGESAEATGTIAAHFCFSAVGIVVAEPEIRAIFRGFHGQQAIGADAAVAIAKSFDGFGVEGNREIAVVDDNEVIAGAVHFVEVEEHGKFGVAEVCRGER